MFLYLCVTASLGDATSEPMSPISMHNKLSENTYICMFIFSYYFILEIKNPANHIICS